MGGLGREVGTVGVDASCCSGSVAMETDAG